jgi:hypothetical protein
VVSEQLRLDGDYGVGGRGGPDPPLTVEQADSLYRAYRPARYDQLTQAILARCLRLGSIHADDLRDVPIGNANLVGVAFNRLRTDGLIVAGEHRASVSPAAHGRRSYVYRLTEKGREFAGLVRDPWA